MKQEKDQRIEIIRLALLASYNEGKAMHKCLANEDAPEIWRQRAESTLHDLDNLEASKPL